MKPFWEVFILTCALILELNCDMWILKNQLIGIGVIEKVNIGNFWKNTFGWQSVSKFLKQIEG